MSLVGRFVNSVQRRGAVPTLTLAWDTAVLYVKEFPDRCLDFARGTETSRVVEAAELKGASAHGEHGFRYHPTASRPFRKLMRSLRIPSEQVFLDIGSGKGRVLILALDFGFKRIVGVEHSAQLCEVARRNLASVLRRRGSTTPVEIQCRDAAEYDFQDDETVIYLYNPFDAVVLAKVMERLCASLRRAPRKIWLIYLHPRWHSAIEATGMFTWESLHAYGTLEFAVFIHDPMNPRLPGALGGPPGAGAQAPTRT
jgi:SAM-dependent methyltransferase